MFYIYRLTCRYYCDTDRRNFYDGHMGFYSTYEKAFDIIARTLGADAILDDENEAGFEVWIANELSHTAYIIDRIQVK